MVVVLLSYLSFHQGLTWHVISMWLIPHPISKQTLAARQSCSFWLNASNHYAVPPEGSWSVLRECLFLESFLLLSWKQPHCMLQTESWVTQVLVLTPHSQCDGIWRDFWGGLHMTFCLLWIGCWVYDTSVAPARVNWDIVMLLADHRHHLLSIDLFVFRHRWQLPWI